MDVFLSVGHFNMGVCGGLTQFWSQHQAAVWRRTDLVLLSVLASSLSHGGYCLGHTDCISAAVLLPALSLHRVCFFTTSHSNPAIFTCCCCYTGLNTFTFRFSSTLTTIVEGVNLMKCCWCEYDFNNRSFSKSICAVSCVSVCVAFEN